MLKTMSKVSYETRTRNSAPIARLQHLVSNLHLDDDVTRVPGQFSRLNLLYSTLPGEVLLAGTK